jgi:hypothetical protein
MRWVAKSKAVEKFQPKYGRSVPCLFFLAILELIFQRENFYSYCLHGLFSEFLSEKMAKLFKMALLNKIAFLIKSAVTTFFELRVIIKDQVSKLGLPHVEIE